jgi:hypothetical protein
MGGYMDEHDRINELQEHVAGLLVAVRDLTVAVEGLATTLAPDDRQRVVALARDARSAMDRADVTGDAAANVGLARARRHDAAADGGGPPR